MGEHPCKGEHKHKWSLYRCLECHFIISVLGSLDSQPNELSEQESSDMLSLPKLESSVDTKESASQNQPENLTESTAGRTVIRFVHCFSKSNTMSFGSMGGDTRG